MSTQGAIVRTTGNSTFKGVYHHWDSYPSGLGRTLWEMYHGFFKRDCQAMIKYLIDDHPAGWSTINDSDFNLPAGYQGMDKDPDTYCGPECYCHGGRSDGPREVNDQNASGCGIEYVYHLDEGPSLVILSSYHQDGEKMIGAFGSGDPDGEKMIGAFGSGDPDATWKELARLPLFGEEPDWKALDQLAYGG